jgi:hypothetical protein
VQENFALKARADDAYGAMLKQDMRLKMGLPNYRRMY